MILAACIPASLFSAAKTSDEILRLIGANSHLRANFSSSYVIYVDCDSSATGPVDVSQVNLKAPSISKNSLKFMSCTRAAAFCGNDF
jgi:hypothetical protein